MHRHPSRRWGPVPPLRRRLSAVRLSRAPFPPRRPAPPVILSEAKDLLTPTCNETTFRSPVGDGAPAVPPLPVRHYFLRRFPLTCGRGKPLPYIQSRTLPLSCRGVACGSRRCVLIRRAMKNALVHPSCRGRRPRRPVSPCHPDRAKRRGILPGFLASVRTDPK